MSPGTYFISVVSSSYGKSAVDGVNYGLKVNYYVPKPSNFKVSTRNTSSLKLSWNKVSGASGYQLQRKVNGNYKHIAYTSNNYYTVKNLSSATSYAFRVRAYKTINGKRYYSSWRTLTTPTKPSKVSIKTPSTNSKHQIIVKWKALSRGSGYQVQYSRKKNFSSVIATKNVSGKTNTSYTGNNFTKGKTYYVRVRAYKTVNGKKYYGAWSSVKSIKCK
ncbi:MAG: fibronectin type III domain-containing protein [Eubacterium sp.]